MNQEPVQFIGQLYDVKAKRDGTGKIILETGADALPALQALLGLLALGDVNLAVVIVPVAQTQLRDSYQQVTSSLDSILDEANFSGFPVEEP